MPNYNIEVTYRYPVDSLDAKDALDTLPQVIKSRYIGVMATGEARIVEACSGKVVLTAKLVEKAEKMEVECSP
jgi:nitroimidazol reductase NimA-like FMN-containing flavoprotein (pyridoxamine 5'-phosphate oxidase superfamily)